MKTENFNKNDKALKISYIIFCVALTILTLFFISIGIYVAVVKSVKVGLGIVFGGAIVCFLFWLNIRLKFSYWVDVKLIRNKLYNKDNSELSFFVKILDTVKTEKHEQELKPKSTTETKLKPKIKLNLEEIEKDIDNCKTLYDKVVLLNKMLTNDVISQEDYDIVKIKILKK